MSEIALELPGAAALEAPESVMVWSQDQVVATQEAEQAKSLSQAAIIARVEELMLQIDLHDSLSTVRYGESVQKRLRSVVDKALQNVISHDMGKIGGLLAEMCGSIESFDSLARKDAGILGALRAGKRREALKTEYAKAAKTLVELQKKLEGCRMRLLVDLSTQEELHQELITHYQELRAHIAAGLNVVEAARSGELQTLWQAAQDGTPETALAYRTFGDQCNVFSKRLEDLQVTEAVCLQSIMQNNVARGTSEQMAEQIQRSFDAIMIWQQTMATVITVQHNQGLIQDGNAKLMRPIQLAQRTQRYAIERAEKWAPTIDELTQLNDPVKHIKKYEVRR